MTTLDIDSSIAAVEKALANPHVAEGEAWTAHLVPSTDSLTYQYRRMYPPRLPGPNRLPSLLIAASPIEGAEFPTTEVFDLELLAHTTPFESLAELLAELRVPIEATEITHRSVAEIIIFPPVAIDQGSQISDGKLTLKVIAHPSIDPGKLRIGFKAFHKNTALSRFALEGSALSWKTDNDVVRGQHNFEMPETPLALALISYEGEFISKWWIRDEALSLNQRHQIHRAVDTADTFRKTFFDDRNDFEERVTLLLELLGLSSLKYGRITTLTAAPDILAVSAEGHLFVVECTTGDINSKGKLQRLHDRTKEIAEALQRSLHPPATVLPVVFTNAPRQETAAHWSTAEVLGIALVCREEITNLLSQLDAPPTADQLHQMALAAIPVTQTLARIGR
jgi:hypothetical protein